MEEIRLTSFSSYGGCGAKLPAEHLDALLSAICGGKTEGSTGSTGLETLDDAAIYKIGGMTLLLTADFFTPIVDDPYTFGQIVAANAMNDIYAMGGTPLTILNLMEFPADQLNAEILTKIVKGGQDKALEAGARIVGGHTLRGSELKYGMAVLGSVESKDLCRNCTARAGDRLILTKPLGVGIIATAIKQGLASQKAIKTACRYMTQLNDKACSIMRETGVNACTDITGFGFIGHSLEMARGSSVGMKIEVDAIPYLKEAAELAEEMRITCLNRDYFSRHVDLLKKPSKIMLDLLYDPQTSGGLLISVSSKKADVLLNKMREQGVEAELIGNVVESPKGRLVLF